MSEDSPSARPPTWWRDLLGPFLWLVLGSALLLGVDADRAWTGLFDGPEPTGAAVSPETDEEWPLGDKVPFQQLYDVGTWPALAVSFAAIAVLLVMQFRPALVCWRRPALYWLSCLAIGPGLVVNAILKDHYGRPRPRDTTDFGGEWSFEPLWQPDWDSPGKSFPNGHASMGFLFIAAYFWLRSRHSRAARAVLFAALAFGCLIGAARLAQGGHFPTDTLWSGGLVWLVCLGLAHGFRLDRNPWTPPASAPARPRPWRALGFGALGLATLFAALLALPANHEEKFRLGAGERPGRASLFLVGEAALHEVVVGGEEPFGTEFESTGHGLPGSRVKARTTTATDDRGRLRYEYKERVSGLHAELVHRTRTRLPGEVGEIKVEAVEGAEPVELVLDLRAQEAGELEVEVIGSFERIRIICVTQIVSINRNGEVSTNPESTELPVREIEVELDNWNGNPDVGLSIERQEADSRGS